MKRFIDEEDDSYESSTDTGDESDRSVGGGNESDGESANPYADGMLPDLYHSNPHHLNQFVSFFLHFIRFVSSLELI